MSPAHASPRPPPQAAPLSRPPQRWSQPWRFVLAWFFSLAMGLVVAFASLALGPRRAWVRCARYWARTTLAIVRVRLVVTGAEHLRGPGIFIANHQSLIDVVIMPALVPQTCRIVAKRELKFVPFLGWGFAISGALLLDRRNPRLAALSLARGVRELPRNWSLALFPEGTRSADGALARFKRGATSLALASKLPIVPVGLYGARQIIGHGEWFVRSGVVHVHVGPPLPTVDWQPHAMRDHVAAGRDAVAACMARAAQNAGAVAPASHLALDCSP